MRLPRLSTPERLRRCTRQPARPVLKAAWASGPAPQAAALRATDMTVPTPLAVAVSLPLASFHLRSTAKAGTDCSSWVDLLTQAANRCRSSVSAAGHPARVQTGPSSVASIAAFP